MPELFEMRNPEIEKLLRELGQDLKRKMPPGWGFTLLISSYGEGGATFYLSSVERGDGINLMKEFVAKMEANG
jgi:hypothetical protein